MNKIATLFSILVLGLVATACSKEQAEDVVEEVTEAAEEVVEDVADATEEADEHDATTFEQPWPTNSHSGQRQQEPKPGSHEQHCYQIGDRRTRELMLTNRVLKAEEALEWGVVNRVVPDEDVMSETMALAKKLAGGPTQAFGEVKALLNTSFDQSLETQMELEARAIAKLIASDDGQEGLDAFLNKRKPEFKG